MTTEQDWMIARRALELGAVAREQIAECISFQQAEQQENRNIPLLQILLRKEYLSQEQARAVMQSLPSSGPTRKRPALQEHVQTPVYDPGTIVPGETKFLHYQIQGILGSGGMSIVYKAYDTKLHRTVALKVLNPNSNSRLIGRFRQETEFLARLDHPNIIKIFEVGDSPQHHYTMEYIEGQIVSALAKNEQLEFDEIARIFYKVADALSEAHKSQVIHRDIKPENIIVDSRLEPKLMDFGIAKNRRSETALTNPGDIVGTPAYMAPEQTKGGDVDKRVDIYAFGATLYEVLCGRAPFEGSYVQILAQIAAEEVIPPRQLRPDIPEELANICLKCLEKSPLNRYPNARQLARELQSFRRRRPTMAASTPTKKPFAKNMMFIAALLCSLIAVSVGGYALLLQKKFDIMRGEKAKIEEKLIAQMEQALHKQEATRQIREQLEILQREQQTSLDLSKEALTALYRIFSENARLRCNPTTIENLINTLQKLKLTSTWEQISPLGSQILERLQILQKKIAEEQRHTLAIRNNPADATVYAERAHWYFHENRHREAIRDLHKAIQINPQLAIAYCDLGNSYLAIGQLAEAEKNYSIAIQIVPQMATAYVNRAMLRADSGREPLSDLDKAMQFNPQLFGFYLNRTLSCSQKTTFPIDRNIPRFADNRQHFQQGYAHYHKKQYHLAIGHWYQVLNSAPRSPDTQFLKDFSHACSQRGNLFFRYRQYRRAIVDWENAIKLGAPDKDALQQWIRKAMAKIR